MIKAVIFDLDNTLIDLMGMKKQCVITSIDAMIKAGLKIDKEKALKIFYGMYMNYNVEDRTIFQKFLRKVNGKVDIKMLTYAILAYRRAKVGYLIPYPGTKKTLTKLKSMGLKLGIVSDAPRERAWLRICSMGLDGFFEVIVTFDETKERKPSTKPFLFAMKRLKVKPSESLMVGDFPDRDIAGGKNLGMVTAFAKYGYITNSFIKKQKNGVKADFVLENVLDLVKIVNGLNKN